MALYAGYESAVHAHRRNSTYAREIDASGAELEPVGRGPDATRSEAFPAGSVAQQGHLGADVVDEGAIFCPAHAGSGDMGDQATVRHEVENLGAFHEHEVVGDKPTMASPPDGLTAHHDRWLASSQAEQLLDPALEAGRLHMVGIGPKGVVPESHVLRAGHGGPPATQLADPLVAEAGGSQPAFHLFLSVLRVPSAARVGPHVDDTAEAGASEERNELFGGLSVP